MMKIEMEDYSLYFALNAVWVKGKDSV